MEIKPDSPIYNSVMSAVYTFLGAVGYMSTNIAYPKGKEYALKALQLDDSIAESHLSIAMVEMFFEWDWKGAEESFSKALELNPGYADAHQYYSMFLQIMDRKDKAIKHPKMTSLLKRMKLID